MVNEEEHYKRGGRIKRKKTKKAKKPKTRRAKQRISRPGVSAPPLPMGGLTTGMGSVVYSAPQAPSYQYPIQIFQLNLVAHLPNERL